MLKALLPSVTRRHTERRIMQTDPRHLFRIIQDVDSYQGFLPLCSHSKVLQRSPCGGSFDAALTVGLPPLFSEKYVSRVTVREKPFLTVETKSIESSLFDSLTSKWILRDGADHTGGCDVDFSVEMTVSDPVVAGVLDKVLQEVAGRQVEAFEKRCQQIPFEQFRKDVRQ